MKQQAKQWLKPLARIGYVSHGLIYLVIGYFAALAAIGAGQTMDSREAVGKIISNGVGGVLAYALMASLVFYAVWRLIQAGFDTDEHGNGFMALLVRVGLLASGVIYLTLAFYIWSLLSASSSPGNGGGFADTLAGFIGSRWASAAIALVLAGVAIGHFIKAFRETYADYIVASEQAMRVIHPVAKVGLIARGIVFLVLAFLFALRAQSAGQNGKPPDSEQALEFIQSLPLGWLLLAAIGLGLVAFACYSFIQAIYRPINIEKA